MVFLEAVCLGQGMLGLDGEVGDDREVKKAALACGYNTILTWFGPVRDAQLRLMGLIFWGLRRRVLEAVYRQGHR